MDNKIILTIGRQFGSGGREIGQRLAKELGIGYYDKELITVAARESGLCEDVFEKADERASSGLSYAFTMGYSSFMGGMFTPYNDILSNDGLFKIQSDAIRKLAETESCVLVGRCADYILRDDPACLSFFIHSSVESRVQKTVERHGVTVEEAKNKAENEQHVNFLYPDTAPFQEAMAPLHTSVLAANPELQSIYDRIQEYNAEYASAN